MILSTLARLFGLSTEVSKGDADASGAEARRVEAVEGTGLLSQAAPSEVEALCQTAREEFQVDMAMVTLLGRDKLFVTAQAGCHFQEAPRSIAFCDYTIRSDQVLVVPDLTKDDRFQANPLVLGDPFVRFYAGAPLIYFRGVRLGSLCLLHPAPRSFSAAECQRLAGLSARVADLIHEQEMDRRTAALMARLPEARRQIGGVQQRSLA
jgi:GAF domain-containing protein